MAQIRRVVRSNPLSNFTQAAPPTGGAFRLMAELADDAYRQLVPAAQKEMEALGSGVGREIAKQQIGDPAGAVTVSTMGGPGPVTPDPGGGWLLYSNQGATRNKPLSGELQTAMSFLPEMGVSMEVFSGGQDGIGEGDQRTGSTRHDHGNAADVFFYKDGRRLDWANDADRPVFEEIVRRGKAAGLTGFGAGPGYMQAGSMHLGFGNPGVWGAEGSGANAPDWLRMAYDGGEAPAQNITVSTSGQQTPSGQIAYAPTMLREADGALTARLYSPLSGPLLQAANAAAGVAYQSEVSLKAMTDIMGLSEQFPLDPEGFSQAADGYVSDMMKSVPDLFKQDVRAMLDTEVKRRVLGMAEERQRDTRQRADNGSRALVERYSDDYAAAIVGGNQDEIAAARSQLDGVLRARESLPGVAWTPEQSFNAVRNAEAAAQRAQEKARNEQISTWKGVLSNIYDAAKNGRTSIDEGILSNPIVDQLLPNEASKARSAIILRDEMPSFMQMAPAEQKAAIEEMRAQPVGQPWETDLFQTAEDAAIENAKAWEKDPIKRASEVLPEKPPALPSADEAMQNPAAFTAALQARSVYAEKLKAGGYVDFTAMLSDDEATQIGAMFSKDVPPEVRAAMAGAVASGLGNASAQFFREIKNDDPVLRMSGMLMARGGDQSVSGMAMRGQSMIDEGLVQTTRNVDLGDDVKAALSSVSISNEADIVNFAKAIYASNARGVDPSSQDAKTMMKEAVQMALGQTTNRRGEKIGGVQRVAGNDVLLPPSINGKALDDAIEQSFITPEMTAGQAFASIWGGVARSPAADMWGAAGIGQSKGSIPMLGGAPLDASLISDGIIKLIPTTNGAYRMQVTMSGGASDVVNENGSIYQFDAQALVDAARKAKK